MAATSADNTVVLTEDDVPGASLQPPYDKHTTTQLRQWLLCRGVSVSTSLKKSKNKYVICSYKCNII